MRDWMNVNAFYTHFFGNLCVDGAVYTCLCTHNTYIQVLEVHELETTRTI